MAKEKAKEFIRYVMNNPEVAEKMKGFTSEELQEAAEELKNDGEVSDNDIEPHFPN